MPEQKTAHVSSNAHDEWKEEQKNAERIEKPDDLCTGTSMPIVEMKPTVSKVPTPKQVHPVEQPVHIKKAPSQNAQVE